MAHNKVYFKATLVAIGIILLNQCFIQYWLYLKREDAILVNISGRQRMYSQKILAQAYLYHMYPQEENRKLLATTYEKWKTSHEYLLEQYQVYHWFIDHKFIHTKLLELTPYIQVVKTNFHKPKDLQNHDLEALSYNQQEFLVKMDTLVKNIEQESQMKLNFVVGIEIIFALISLALIYYEITFVFQKINQNLAKKNEELISSNQMLEEYAYLAAHDLRLPTQNVINFSKILRKKLNDRMTVTEKKYFGFIQESTERLKKTTEDLLNFARINGEDIDLKQCDPLHIFNHILEDLQGTISEKEAVINIENLPTSIEGDESLLRLVFLNLISNALKFVPADTSPNLNIQYEASQKHHLFSIQDNGIGIPEDKQEQIFGLFKRLHNQEEFVGTGIGLSICQKVIEKHQGHIYLNSNQTGGSTFFVQLPMQISN